MGVCAAGCRIWSLQTDGNGCYGVWRVEFSLFCAELGVQVAAGWYAGWVCGLGLGPATLRLAEGTQRAIHSAITAEMGRRRSWRVEHPLLQETGATEGAPGLCGPEKWRLSSPVRCGCCVCQGSATIHAGCEPSVCGAGGISTPWRTEFRHLSCQARPQRAGAI